MLTRLCVKNFRLLRSVSIDVTPGHPIVLIGPNGAGKSSVVDVLDILSRATQQPLNKALAPFGPVQTAGVSDPMEVEVTLGGEPALRYGLQFDELAHVAREWVDSLRVEGDRPIYRIDADGAWAWNERLDQKVAFDADDWDGSILQDRRPRRSYPSLARIQEELRTIQVYRGFPTTPLWSRDPREGQAIAGESTTVAPVPRLDSRGFELVNALNHLRINHDAAWRDLINAFRGEFPFVSKIDFPPDAGGGRIGLAWWDERFGNKRFYGFQMSEGMLTFLCLLAAILNPEPAAALVFDEPDQHLHPSALRRLMNLLEGAAERSAVILATHSDRILDYLSDPAASLRICAASREGVSIQPLDREALDAWRKEYTLSELRAGHYMDQDNVEVLEP
jgi:predicted ATPase